MSELSITKPPRLKPGDTVGVVSPAGITFEPVEIEILQETLVALGLGMKLGAHAQARWGYLAGIDAQRADDLNQMFLDPEVDAILALRGGWGSARLLPLLDYEAIRRHPKALIGYSDITSLLVAIYARSGVITFHGPNGASTWNSFTAEGFKQVLFGVEPVTLRNPSGRGDTLAQVEDRVRTIRAGKARGRLVGGNLTVLSTLLGSDYLPDWSGHILFLEDVNEAVYRIDRMLTQLKLAGVLGQVAGVVVGRCTRCEPGSGISAFTLEEVLRDHLEPLNIPAWHGAMIGHIERMFTLPLGIEAEIDAQAGTIRLLEPAVC